VILNGRSKRITFLVLVVLACVLAFASGATPAAAQELENSLGKIKRANTAAIDCGACPRSLAQAGKAAKELLATWARFQIVDDPGQAEVLFIFSGNPYTGDYLTRKGPDERPVRISSTFMTVIDPHTGEELWSDSRDWGSWRVSGATRALIDELRNELEVETKKWTLAEVFRCSVAPAFQPFAFLSRAAALDKPEMGVRMMEDAPDRLSVNPPDAPDFCRRAQLVVGGDGKISRYEVVASPSDGLDVADVLEQADQFDFASGKDTRTQKAYFTAQSKNKKVLIRFDVQGHRIVLSRVSYFY
jgi:hypothetical protein